MAGVKGRSGRKAYLDDKSISQLCRLSLANIYRAFRSPTLSEEIKVDLSKHFVLRAMPQKVESDGSFAPKTVVIMRNDKSVERLESAVGI